MKRYTKIICTLGPSSNSESMIKKMALRGMDVARINFSHGNHLQHQKMIDAVRAVNEQHNLAVSILIDLEGYRIRIGRFKKNITLKRSQRLVMSNEPYQGSDHIPFDYNEDVKAIEKGANIYIDDGKIYLRVTGHSGKKLKVKVIQGGILSERKGVNIPQLKLQSNLITEKDRKGLEFGIENKVEKIAQSFVRNKNNIQHVVDIVRPRLPQCTIIAKIENEEGVRNIGSIIDACDGMMVARGDLGVTLPIYKIPIVQKYLIRHTNRKKKLSVTATQMLDSMIENGRPTRAEVSDVANAILDGTDYVMLSGETAVGRYPSRSVKMMRQIIEYTESHEDAKLK